MTTHLTSRCLDKLQLFQPSFEICPFETELNVDVTAALKVHLDPSGPTQPVTHDPSPNLPLSRLSPLPCCLVASDAERQP